MRHVHLSACINTVDSFFHFSLSINQQARYGFDHIRICSWHNGINGPLRDFTLHRLHDPVKYIHAPKYVIEKRSYRSDDVMGVVGRFPLGFCDVHSDLDISIRLHTRLLNNKT